MAAIPQRQEPDEAPDPPSQSPEDYYSALVSAIAEAANDPARVRKLVYAVVRSNLNPERVFTPSLTDATWQAKSLAELDQAFQIERAIRRLEERTGPRVYEPDGPAPASFSESPETAPVSHARAPIPFQPSLLPPQYGVETIRPAETPRLPAVPDAVAEIMQGQLQRGSTLPDEQPAWLTAGADASTEAQSRTQGERLWAAWITLPSHVHVVAAALVVATVLTGLSGLKWGRAGRGTVEATAPAVPPAPAAPAVSVVFKGPKITETVGSSRTAGPEADPAQPMPQSFGVYAAHNGLLTQLDPLPVTISMANMRASAEIVQPSRITLAADKLSFVVFDRDFANGAPQTVSARVVGRVSRLVKYVDGKVRVTPHQGSWRVRDKSYELKVSPLEGRDILVIRPDSGLVLPPGRYALVLNGRGYDFTVAGRVTAPEQCLEQTEVVNGVVVGDCTNL